LATGTSALSTRVGLVLVGVMWSLPFVQPRHFSPLPLFYSEWLAVILGLAAMFVLMLPRHARELEIPWITLTPLALIVVLLLHLSLVKAAYAQQVFIAVLYLLWAAGLIVLGALLRREVGLPRMTVTLAWFLLAGGLLSALAAVLQHYEIRGFLEPVIATKIGYSVYGNLTQYNHFADQIALALVSVMFLYVKERTPAVVAALFSCILLFVLSVTGSRTAWLYLAAIAALAGLLYLRDKSADHKRLLIFAVLLLPAFALVQVLAYSPWLTPPTRLITPSERFLEPVSGLDTRLQLWSDAWNMFLDSPLLGVGHGQYVWQHFLLASNLDAPPLASYANNAHNILLHLLAETGAIGLLVVMAGVLIWVWGSRRLKTGLDAWWLLAVLMVLGIHSMLEYPLWYAYFLGIASILLGAGECRSFRVNLQPAPRAGIGVLMIVGWLSALSLVYNYYLLEVSLFPRPKNASKAELDRAHRDLMSVHGSLLTPYVELAIARALDLDTQNLDGKIEFSSRVMRFAPTPVIAYQHAALLALKGDRLGALQYLDHAAAAYPERLRFFADDFASLTGRHQAVIAAFQQRFHKHLEAQERKPQVR
jgi:O-antigen ligase